MRIKEIKSFEVYIHGLGMNYLTTLSEDDIIKVLYENENGDNSYRAIGRFISIQNNESGEQCLLLDVSDKYNFKTVHIAIKNIRSIVDVY